MNLFQNETIERRMAARDGRTAGFDYLRIVLAISVIAFHSAITSYGVGPDRALAEGWIRPFTTAILPMFFALSGFLVASSLDRARTLVEYAALRALRLVPALFVEVCVAALILGPLLTSFTLPAYFADGALYSYFLNVVGHIHFHLPGLFLANPDPDMVNRQLWTIPGELKCYFVLLALAAVGLHRRPKALVAVVVALGLVSPFYDSAIKHEDVRALNTVTMNTLVIAFLCGVAIHAFRDRIKTGAAAIVGAAAACYALMLVPELQYAAMAPMAYLTVAIGVSDLPRSPLSAAGDLSYGLYLYGYPLQQTYAQLFPDHRVPALNILFTLVVGGALAALSWRFVEKPVLTRRARILALLPPWSGRRASAPSAAFRS